MILSKSGRCLAAMLAVAAACGRGDSPAAPDAMPAPALTWTTFADSFFATYCQACHGPGDALRDYSVLTMVKAESAKIRCGVSAATLTGCSIPAKQFPVGSGPKPTDEQRAELVRWLDEGAVE